MIGRSIALVGAVLILLSAIGVTRFRDPLSRMHALTKATTVGIVFTAVGAAFELPTANDVTSALAAGLLQVLALPISAVMIARATYQAREIPSRVDDVDERAQAAEREPPTADDLTPPGGA